MERGPNVLTIARAAVTEFDSDAPTMMLKRANDHARVGEAEGADVWRRVADAVGQILAERRSKEP